MFQNSQCFHIFHQRFINFAHFRKSTICSPMAQFSVVRNFLTSLQNFHKVTHFLRTCENSGSQLFTIFSQSFHDLLNCRAFTHFFTNLANSRESAIFPPFFHQPTNLSPSLLQLANASQTLKLVASLFGCRPFHHLCTSSPSVYIFSTNRADARAPSAMVVARRS